jgi:hypothetical protein
MLLGVAVGLSVSAISLALVLTPEKKSPQIKSHPKKLIKKAAKL